MEQIRISGKNLGDFSIPNYCERCLWIKMKLGNKLPFQIFPGIFSSIDSYTKKITNLYHQHHNYLPMILQSFGLNGKPIKVPHHSKFFVMDEEFDIRLTGAPDEILQNENGNYVILDYKTAKFTEAQDELLPIYDTQLNAYTYIAENTGMSPVTEIALIYFEPQTDIQPAGVTELVNESGFSMKFDGKFLPIQIDLGKIKPLLKKARELFDRQEMPQMGKDCKDCSTVSDLIALF